LLKGVSKESSMEVLSVRQVELADALDLLSWRNDALTRAMSHSTSVISLEQHLTWFNNVLNDPGRYLLIAVAGEQKVGMVRYDRLSDNEWEVSIVMAPQARGRGLGKQLLFQGLQRFYIEHPHVSLLAEIKTGNTVSQALFTSLGFLLDVECEDVRRYVLRGG
jgi:UDP-2,4-diacetamido-2,4,6-trideoxy-beta-L-altropyranose hydrolase